MESNDDPGGSCSLWKRAKDRFNPKKTYHHVKRITIKHGWKIGAIAITFEVAEHFVLPAVLVAMTGQPEFLTLSILPIGETLFYPSLFYFLGR